MPLHQFMREYRDEILKLTARDISNTPNSGTEQEITHGLPDLFDQIVDALRTQAGVATSLPHQSTETATAHGAQRKRLGFTLAQLVHDYGALCHAVTQVAEDTHQEMTPLEYQKLNQTMDKAIADAVSEFASLDVSEHDREIYQKANEHLGFVAHELRNAVAGALLAYDAIRRGRVAIGGRTSKVLERSLLRLRVLVERSLTEVRLKSSLVLSREPTRFGDLLDEVEAAATVDAEPKGAHIRVQGDLNLEGTVDRQLLVSALSNLVQNALKYSRHGATIYLRCHAVGGDAVFEVEDECGGLPETKFDDLFSPFVRGTTQGSGLGLGLAITREAVEAHGGRVHLRNMPGKGCVFVVTIPLEAREAEVDEPQPSIH